MEYYIINTISCLLVSWCCDKRSGIEENLLANKSNVSSRLIIVSVVSLSPCVCDDDDTKVLIKTTQKFDFGKVDRDEEGERYRCGVGVER